MPYNTVNDRFHTKKLCSRLSSREVRFFSILEENWPFCVFEPPPLFFWGGGLGATYNNHLTLIGKRVLDFLLVY